MNKYKKLLKQLEKTTKEFDKWLEENKNNPAKGFIILIFYTQLLYMIESGILKIKHNNNTKTKIQIGGVVKNEYDNSNGEVKL